MEWWQILLVAIASLVVGILLGALLDYSLRQFVKKRGALLGAFLDYSFKRFAKKHGAPLVIKEQTKYALPDLLEEIKNNRKIAAEPWTGKLLPFQTHIWDAHQYEFHELPANLWENLVQVYMDIRLANSIVRLSIAFNHRTHDLDKSYMKLYTSIAERLDRIKSLIEGLEK